ncbi:MAG TPA: carboxyltransferase domain-containing protein, partial [Pirellulaceae bacterium]|nr:carboxyltransferase domain-containing protein [Pirellulaceae bacterium]
MIEAGLPRFVPLGDRALVVHLGEKIDEASFQAVRALSRKLATQPPAGTVEIVPAFTTLAIYYDPLQTTTSELTKQIRGLAADDDRWSQEDQRVIEIPVCYGG